MISDLEGEGIYLPAGTFYPYTSSDQAEFKVEVTFPEQLEILTSGKLEKKQPLNGKKTYVFTVKNAQLTYAGRLTMKFTGERGLFGLKASSVDYHVLWSDTVPEDELWAEAAFPVLRNMPSGAEPMYCLPVSTQH